MDLANRAPYGIGDDGRPDTSTVYLRCPHCMALAVPLGLTYSPAGVGGISPDHPVEATTRGLCAADHDTTTAAIVARDADRACACARCRFTFAVPVAADEVVCPACRLHQPGPATLADPRRAADVDRIRTAYLAAVQARLRSLHHADDEDPAAHRPFYTDDPLVNQSAHRLTIHHDPDASAHVGHRLEFGICSCGEWVTPSWDTSAVVEAYEQHMTEIQTTAHEQARKAGR